MSDVVSVDGLADAIMQSLEAYTDDVTENVKNAVDTVADEVNETIKEHVKFVQRTGDYVKAFRLKTVEEDKYHKIKVWYVASPHYRLTHLLEKGHALRQGGRTTRSFPHIEYGQELAEKRMMELAEEAIKNAGH